MEHDVIEWDAPEYYHEPRSADWFWSYGIIVASIAILSVLFSNILFAIFIILAGILAGYYAAREPDIIHCELQPLGILAGKIFYDYTDIKSFWVDDNHPHTKLVLISHKALSPHIVIPVDDITHPIDITDYLIHYIPQVKGEETFFHKLMEQVGL